MDFLGRFFLSLAKGFGYVEPICPEPEPEKPWSPYPPVGSQERISNQGWIMPADVVKYPDKMVLSGSFIKVVLPNTNSMEGWMDEGHTVILSENFKPESLKVGDIAAYELYGKWILHQIIKIDKDLTGRLYTFQGVNCAAQDAYQVRDSHIKAVLVAIIYTHV